MITRAELGRQFFHLTIGLLAVFLYYVGIFNTLTLMGVLLISFALSLLSKKMKLPVIGFLLESFDREGDKKRFPGKGFLTFFFGMWLVVSIFERQVALPSLMILTLGDSFATIAGLSIGRLKMPFSKDKTFEGTIAGIVAGSLGAYLFLGNWYTALIASAAAMIVESVDIMTKEPFDDNVLVPITAALVIVLVH